MPQHKEAADERNSPSAQRHGAARTDHDPSLEPGKRDPAAGSALASDTQPRAETGAETAAAGAGRPGEPGQSKGLGVDATAARSAAKAGQPVGPGESARSEGAGDAGGTGVSAVTASSGTSLISAEAERQATVPVGTEGKGAAYGPAATAELNGPVGSKEVGRPGKALLAAAAIAGVLLISVPFLIAVGDGGRPGASESPGTVLGGGGTEAPGTFSAASPDARHGGGPKAGGATVPGSGAEASGRGREEAGFLAGEDNAEKKAKGVAGEPGTTAAPTPAADKSASTQSSGTPPQAPKALAASAVVYTGVVGHGCPTPVGGGYKQVNYYSDGTAGWYTRTTGAWTGDGCSGSYAAVPMSGSTSTDRESRVMWWWRPGTEARTCQISVFIPHSNTTLYVGGHPSTYHVLVDANDRTTKYSSFTVNQAGLRGQWIGVGTFPVKGPTIGVKLLDRGDDWSSGWAKAHHAAAQMKATCRS